MSTEQTDDRPPAAGGLAHAFGNALAWKWVRQMPRALKGGFLTQLYALRSMAASSGQLRFQDGTVIRIQDLAKAAGCREQDTRRYLEAAIRAGVVVVEGERKRGKPTLYRLVVTPWPSWGAAADHLKATARPRKEEPGDGSSGHSGTNQFGPQRHELDREPGGEVRATVARPGSGHSGTTGSVHSGPNNPGSNQEDPQEVAEVGPQPQVDGAARTDKTDRSAEARPFGRCAECGVPLARPGTTRCSRHRDPAPGQRGRSAGRRRPIQAPLLMPVPGAPEEPSATPQAPASRPADPFAPIRLCSCGRDYRDRQPGGRCPDCVQLGREEAARLGIPEARNA
ncbi:hypothetical protein [Streptomyces sp. NRRL B-1347]|uniref:hypothetical protein n=1 Tax=Streptomyces sp. NRRL B-1347 TaxID=1476877 RepID=UPI0004C85F5B|nr:hypothetical protein [Streptomyces sp. NRRL B-1347]